MAEVLITLAIIGVVAALTIPVLSSKIQEAVLNNQFKKFYSMFKQGVMSVQTLQGGPIKCFYWEEKPYTCTLVCKQENEYGTCQAYVCAETGKPLPSDYDGAFSGCKDFYDVLFYDTFKVSKICENNAYANGCLPKDIRGADKVRKEQQPDMDFDPDMEFGDNAIKTRYPVFVLQDGSYIIKMGGMVGGRPVFAFDINGQKGPNKWGYDLYGVIFRGNSQNGITTFNPYCPVEEGGKSIYTRQKELGIK